MGPAGALWGGHDFWIADQWSLGGELRIIALTAERDFSDLDGSSRDNALSVEAVFTAVFH